MNTVPSMPLNFRNVGAWPPALNHLAPAELVDASNAAAEAHDRLVSAEDDCIAARADLAEAKKFDEVETLRAVEEGKSAPKATAPARETKVETADRLARALRKVTEQKDNEYLDLVVTNHPALLAGIDSEIARTNSEIDAAIESVAGRFAERADLQLAREQLGDDVGWLQGRAVDFRPAREGHMLDRDPVPTDCRRLLSELRDKLREPELQRAAW